jgi:hypothetical protein
MVGILLWLCSACGGDDSATTGPGGAATGSAGNGGRAGATVGAAGSGGSAGSGPGAGGAAGTAGSDRDGSAGTTGGGSGGSGGATDDSGPSDRNAAGSAGRDAEAGRSDDGGRAEAPSDGSKEAADGAPLPVEGGACGLPGSGLYATFRAVDIFYVWITNPTGIDEAIALWRGQSMASIPVGGVDCANGALNCGWSWRMKPDTVRFAEVTIELCDGRPSYVEGHCAAFATTYCPWGAQLVALRDCRTDASCPMVTR